MPKGRNLPNNQDIIVPMKRKLTNDDQGGGEKVKIKK